MREENENAASSIPTGAVLCGMMVLAAGVSAWKLGLVETRGPTPSASPQSGQTSAEDRVDASAVKARLHLERFRSSVAEVEDQISTLRAKAQGRHGTIRGFETNDAGKRIASDEEALVTARGLLRKSRIEVSGVDALGQRVSYITDYVQALLAAGPPYTRADLALADELAHLRSEVHSHDEALSDDLAVAVALLSRTRDNSPAETTLRDAIEAYDEEQAALEGERLAATAREREEAELASKVEEERLRELAGSAEIGRLYSAFLSKGHFNSRTRQVEPGPPFPVSVTNLNWHGVLSDDYLFASFACGRPCEYQGQGIHPGSGTLVFQRNDRPTAIDYPTTDDQWTVWRERREQFATLVPTFIELGMLRP